MVGFGLSLVPNQCSQSACTLTYAHPAMSVELEKACTVRSGAPPTIPHTPLRGLNLDSWTPVDALSQATRFILVTKSLQGQSIVNRRSL